MYLSHKFEKANQQISKANNLNKQDFFVFLIISSNPDLLRRMNNIISAIEEIILNEIVYR